MSSSKKTLALMVGSALVTTLAYTSVQAGQNPFTAKTLTSGYMLADADGKMKDGKCGTGKCGADKKKMEDKAKEASCSADKKAKEGACSGDKAKEASCSADKKS